MTFGSRARERRCRGVGLSGVRGDSGSREGLSQLAYKVFRAAGYIWEVVWPGYFSMLLMRVIMHCILELSVRTDLPGFLSFIGGELGSVEDVTFTNGLVLVGGCEVGLDVGEGAMGVEWSEAG